MQLEEIGSFAKVFYPHQIRMLSSLRLRDRTNIQLEGNYEVNEVLNSCTQTGVDNVLLYATCREELLNGTFKSWLGRVQRSTS